MSFSTFIAARISFRSKRTFSRLIVRIAIIGIMLGLSVMILTIAIVKGFKQEIRGKVRGFGGDISVIKYDLNTSYENSSFSTSPSVIRQIKAKPFVTGVSAVATKAGIIRANNEIEGVLLKGVDTDYDRRFFAENMVSGKPIDPADTSGKDQIMISTYTATRLKLKMGDSFVMYFMMGDHPRKRKFFITGIYDAGVEEVNKTYAVGSLKVIQLLNNWKPGEVGAYEVRVADFEKLHRSNKTIRDVIPVDLRSITILDTYPQLFEWLHLLDANTNVLIALMLAVAVINMISALLVMILERTTMIGLLKALGSNNWKIQEIFLYNAGYLIGLGLLLGNLLGIGLSLLQYHTHAFKLDPASYYMKFVPIQLEWADVLALNLGTLAVSLLILILPSMLVSRISPVKAIKFK
ncbi:ABC transporter permease [Mucilaginibacter myungsuensis]|uniref:ABC transporter permease n=1 Tax=Mucilaginibacter myungsuensis TaxID=649104 RepID=A0A929L5V4_9SPHI|nr:FtsX-like permease family protein [Mucilaginibacter myungsuensis]MBE9664545.1 ABC transporter permease [Mucilaginibacter myungsuensis]MDN3601105.1 ABC transporter permease [Mucilaginibacter myungsuensis]